MSKRVRDAMTNKPRVVEPSTPVIADRDVVTTITDRVILVEEDGRQVGILAQTAVAEHGRDSQTGQSVEKMSN